MENGTGQSKSWTVGKSTASDEYASWVQSLKKRVIAARQRAVLAVNSELIRLYWDIGHELVKRQDAQGWGSKVLERTSRELSAAFPDMDGFSVTNLKYMRMFASNWTRRQISQQAVDQIPWGHNIVLLTKLSSVTDRILYARLAIEYGWSRNVLLHQIDIGAARALQKPASNFRTTLPHNDSELMEQTLKDSYNLSFIQASGRISENRLRAKLVDRASNFLLELGAGFAYVGKGVSIEVGGDDFEKRSKELMK